MLRLSTKYQNFLSPGLLSCKNLTNQGGAAENLITLVTLSLGIFGVLMVLLALGSFGRLGLWQNRIEGSSFLFSLVMGGRHLVDIIGDFSWTEGVTFRGHFW